MSKIYHKCVVLGIKNAYIYLYACMYLNTEHCLISALFPQIPGYYEGLSKTNNIPRWAGETLT